VIGGESVGLARGDTLLSEFRKLPAFLRRDLLVAWSYRTAFLSDWAGLLVQVLLFSYVGRIVDNAKLPTYGDAHATYLEFVAIGIALGVFVQIGLTQITAGLRQEQLQGTLESLLITPTSPTTIQLGSVMYQLVYVPLRTAVFLVLLAFAGNVRFEAAGAPPAAMIMLAFIPFIWGLGVMSAAATLTFRRGTGAFSLGVGLLTLASGAYFPLELLPHWLSTVASHNPMAVAIDGMRSALIGGTGWGDVPHRLAVVLPFSGGAFALGVLAFRRAVRRELRRGTLGLY
jgi:ABC-2 type transport system permease protein